MRFVTVAVLIILLIVSINEINIVVGKFEERLDCVSKQIKCIQENIEGIEGWIKRWDMEEFEITAYTLQCGNGDGYTATMTIPHEGIIAVDPNVIPLHSRVYIDGMGWFSAEDTGSAIKGNRIDVFVNSLQKALTIGRSSTKVIYRRG